MNKACGLYTFCLEVGCWISSSAEIGSANFGAILTPTPVVRDARIHV